MIPGQVLELCLQGLGTLALLQTKLYSLAVERLEGKSPASATLEAIETGQLRPYVPTAAHTRQVLATLQRTVGRIRRQEYDAQPNATICSACSFQKSCASSVANR